MKKTKIKTIRGSRQAYWFIAPLVIIMLVFLAYPIFKAATMSVEYWYLTKPSPDGHYFVGLKNYIDVFKDEYFINSTWVTIKYMFVTVIGRFLLGFGAALLLNKSFKGRGLARALLIIPWAVPEVVACLVWILMYDKDFGVVNYMLQNMGLISTNIAFLQDAGVALPAAMAVNIWKGFPFVAIMLLAGMQSIDQQLYEAATVDGASSFHKFRYVTLPSLRPVSLVVMLLLIIWTIKDFAIAYLLAKGGPSRATEILTIFVQQTAFKYFNFGKAAATGMIMLVISFLFTGVYFKVLNKGEKKV